MADALMSLVPYVLLGGFGALMLAGIIFWFLAPYHMIGTMAGFKDRRRRIAGGLIPPLTFFIPALFTEQGNYHRRRLLLYTAAVLDCVSGGFLLGAVLPADSPGTGSPVGG